MHYGELVMIIGEDWGVDLQFFIKEGVLLEDTSFVKGNSIIIQSSLRELEDFNDVYNRLKSNIFYLLDEYRLHYVA